MAMESRLADTSTSVSVRSSSTACCSKFTLANESLVIFIFSVSWPHDSIMAAQPRHITNTVFFIIPYSYLVKHYFANTFLPFPPERTTYSPLRNAVFEPALRPFRS